VPGLPFVAAGAAARFVWEVSVGAFVKAQHSRERDASPFPATTPFLAVHPGTTKPRTGAMFSPQIYHQILLYKKKIFITSKYRHMHGVLNVDEIEK
jgi:hypothetical protein